jgi:predicted enzyme related to lactoylglutathione lyase
MAAQPEGTPIWADAMFADLEGAKKFYGEVLGWTFGESSSEFGNYTEAYADGKAVAAVVPPMPGAEEQSAWCLYLATADAEATATRIRENGGEIVLEPMQVADFGTMCIARDPGGVAFGLWQSGKHTGFDAVGTPGAYCWAEIYTREAGKADGFFPKVFSYTQKDMPDDAIDFRVYELNGAPLLGRMRMTEEFPPEVPAFVNVYFTVSDCDEAVAKAGKLGAQVLYGPMTSPFGRFATLIDPQGAPFSLLDPEKTEGEMPELNEVG